MKKFFKERAIPILIGIIVGIIMNMIIDKFFC